MGSNCQSGLQVTKCESNVWTNTYVNMLMNEIAPLVFTVNARYLPPICVIPDAPFSI